MSHFHHASGAVLPLLLLLRPLQLLQLQLLRGRRDLRQGYPADDTARTMLPLPLPSSPYALRVGSAAAAPGGSLLPLALVPEPEVL
ncbi:hypothetical protein B0H14DRAFT_3463083 [Mycena olivaceomarginata]|nr:hypothetical protein B0H14DRAFT_3463083 [Mycena olivaceomarginata]